MYKPKVHNSMQNLGPNENFTGFIDPSLKNDESATQFPNSVFEGSIQDSQSDWNFTSFL